MDMHVRGINPTTAPRKRVIENKVKTFNQEVSNRYKKHLVPYKSGMDKNCVATLPKKYMGEGSLPLIIPPESEMSSLSVDVIACLYHRYVTTIQIQCAFMDRLGDIKRNGWNICGDPAYLPSISCNAFLSNDVFQENKFSADLKSRYGCEVKKAPLSIGNSLQSWKNKFNLTNDVVDILTFSVSISNLAVIDAMVKDNSISQVRQLLMQLQFDPGHVTAGDYIKVLLRLQELHKKGFRIVWFERIFQCSTDKFNKCYAVYFVQENLKDESKGLTVVNLPLEEKIQSMNGKERADLYFKYVQTTQILCQNIFRMGRIVDGGWEVCHDLLANYKRSCIAYSFGVLNDLTFDDELAETYPCSVFSFDPTTPFPTHQHAPKVWFFQLGIGSKYEKFNAGYVAPLKYIRADLNHTRSPIAILKIDVEGAEWSSLPEMIASNQLNDVQQLYLEFHALGDKAIELSVLKKLYDIGFRIFWFHANPECSFDSKIPTRSRCMEVYFINTRFQAKI